MAQPGAKGGTGTNVPTTLATQSGTTQPQQQSYGALGSTNQYNPITANNPQPQNPQSTLQLPQGGFTPNYGMYQQPQAPQNTQNQANINYAPKPPAPPGGKGGTLNPTTTFPGPGGQQAYVIPGQLMSQQQEQELIQRQQSPGFAPLGQDGMMGGKMDPAYQAYAKALQGTPAGQMPPQQMPPEMMAQIQRQQQDFAKMNPQQQQAAMGGKGGTLIESAIGRPVQQPTPPAPGGGMFGGLTPGGANYANSENPMIGNAPPGPQQQDFANMFPQIAEQMRQQQMAQLNPQQQQNAMQYGNAYYGEPQRMATPAEMAKSGLSQMPQPTPTATPMSQPTPTATPMSQPQIAPAPTTQQIAQPSPIQAAQRALQTMPAPAPTTQRVGPPSSKLNLDRVAQAEARKKTTLQNLGIPYKP
jgi:hypothetical protein